MKKKKIKSNFFDGLTYMDGFIDCYLKIKWAVQNGLSAEQALKCMENAIIKTGWEIKNAK